VASNDGNSGLGGVLLAGDLSNEGLGSDDIKSGHAEQFLGVKDTGGLEDFGGDWDCGVDGVGDDEEIGLWTVLGGALDEITDDTGVDLEEIITGHTRLAFFVISACLVTFLRVVGCVRGTPAGMTTMSAPVKACFMPSSFGRNPLIFCPSFSRDSTIVQRASAYCFAGDVGEIGSNAGRVDNIVQSELVDEGVSLEEERQWLAQY
jgi:hypothetical protein